MRLALLAVAALGAAPVQAQDASDQGGLHRETLRSDPVGLSTSAVPVAPGLMEERAPLYVSCVAATPAAVLRSDVIPLGDRTVRTIETRWAAYVQAREPTAVGRRCEPARALGKSAAYSDLDARVRRLQRQSNTTEARYTGWRG